MSTRRLPLSGLPYWPLWLTREEAAAYVGVSPNVFALEVAAGIWPAGKPRGEKGGRLTWHRPTLDAWSQRMDPGEADDYEQRREAAAAERRKARHATAR